MSKYVKILLQAIALLCITLGVFSAQAMAKTNIQYEVINGDTLVISGNGETEEAIKYGKEVKKSQIKKLIIKEGITKITPLGIGKFEYVREIVLPDSLTEIGDTTFAGCYKLKKVRFGKGLQVIGYSAFASCISLEEIDIPDSVVEISESVFASCHKLKKITLPERLKEWNFNTS